MNLILALDHRFLRTPDGSYWSTTIYPRSFWDRYLGVFERLTIVARVRDTDSQLTSWKRVDDGNRVAFVALPSYIGPMGFVRNFLRIRASIRTADLNSSAILLRVPGMVPWMVASCLRPGQPYGIEVVGDPYDVFSPHATSHPARPFFRWSFSRMLRRQCQQGACSLYVTERALQARYAPAPGRLSVGVSDSDLQDDAFVKSIPEARSFRPEPSSNDGHRSGGDSPHRFRVIFVGTLEVLYKAPDVLVAAFAQSVDQGLDGELVMVGDGRERPAIERLARRLKVHGRVKFLGQLSGGEAIRRELDSSDLFVLPSHQEGLPRAMIEAMARGLPCIGARVGGILELLPDVALVPPNDVNALATKILYLARDPKLRSELARMNLAVARRYHESVLQPKRIPFYERLAAVTLEWQQAHRPSR